ncbi:MAG: hypothetical protein U0V54_09450 [Saprospiraceae bacterium]|nr:hypothetical protein [Saprospiraceae bacterium]
MKFYQFFTSFLLILFLVQISYSQDQIDIFKLYKDNETFAIHCAISETKYMGKKCVKVVDTGLDTSLKFVKLLPTHFKNGTIEVELSGKPGPNAYAGARGFVGLAFRIKEDNSTFECIYLRPGNSRVMDQARRNHSVQYISYPAYPWHKLRKETPEVYESYVDLIPGEWTRVKIVVKDEKARLYVHGQSQPTLVINDLKLGADQSGAIGLWIGPGTEAHFANLVVKEDQSGE